MPPFLNRHLSSDQWPLLQKVVKYQNSFLFVKDLLGVVLYLFFFVPVKLVKVVFLAGVLVEG